MEVSGKLIVVLVAAGSIGGALLQKQWDGKDVQKIQDLLTASEKNHTITVIKKVTKPDGTVEEDTTRTEDQVKKETEKKMAEVSTPAYSPTWLISAGAAVGLDMVPYYSLNVNRQILGPVWLGAYVTTHKEFGASVGILF